MSVTFAPDPPVLETHSIGKRFAGFAALEGVSLTLRAGKVHSLVGQNGAGKSTLIKILTRAHRQFDGAASFLGRDLASFGALSALQAGITAVYQELDLVDDLSISENIHLGHEPARAGWLDRRAARVNATRLLSGLGLALDPATLVGRLSLAQKQLVALARALSFDSKLIVLDEPTASLSARESKRLLETLRQLADEGRAVVFISHRLEEVFKVSDEISVLRGGKLIASRVTAEWNTAGLIQAMTGRTGRLYPERVAAPLGEVLLSARNLSRAPAVREVNLELRAGEVLGIAGLVGAGRTELLRCLAGADRYTGSVSAGGTALRSPQDALRAGVAYAPEDRKAQGLLLDLTLEENLTLPVLRRYSRFGLIDPSARRAAAAGAVRDLGIEPPNLERDARLFSGGNQQKAVVARWLLSGARVLLLDEPTRGVDIGAKADLFTLIRRLASEGQAVIFVSSELEEVAAISDRLLVMVEGQIVSELPGGANEAEILDVIYARSIPSAGVTP